MLPLRDSIPSRTVPYVNYAIIGICAVVYFAQSQEPPDGPSLVERYGMIPARVRDPQANIQIPSIELRQTPRGIEQVQVTKPAAPSAVPPWMTMLTCIFLHGSIMHILGNMWFLFIFGDNVEDRFGHVGYLLFYLLCGVSASLGHYLSGPNSNLPTIGASGAIAGVMGAYFVWYPRAHVQALIPLGIIMQIMVVPAPLFLGIWFLLQFLQGAMVSGEEAGGVAWWAHIGGFVVGVALAFVLGKTPLLRPKMQELPSASHSGVYRMRRG